MNPHDLETILDQLGDYIALEAAGQDAAEVYPEMAFHIATSVEVAEAYKAKVRDSQKKLRALFACAADGCAEEYSWPASDLYWCPEEQGWVCDNCLSQSEDWHQGISLKEWLLKADPPIRGFL